MRPTASQSARRSYSANRAPSASPLAVLGVAALFAAVLLGGLRGSDAAGATGDGKPIFDRFCQGCHTIGGGKLAGPDLQDLADRRQEQWVRDFILAPDKMIAAGDPIAKGLVEEWGGVAMPNLGLTADQVGALLPFLGFTAGVGQTTPEETTPQPTTPEPTTPAPTPGGREASRGKSLFTGATRFSAGGPGCLSCHSVAGVGALGGGRLGPDLTDSFAKYGGEKGLRGVLTAIPFPTMAPIYSRRPLTAREGNDLVAFLATAPDKQRPARTAVKLVGFSAAAAAALVVIGMGVWRNRLNGVRKPLVKNSKRK